MSDRIHRRAKALCVNGPLKEPFVSKELESLTGNNKVVKARNVEQSSAILELIG